jgi:UDPglucose 6-dehydrogenase
VKALIAQAKANDVDVPLLSAVMDINKGQPLKLVDIARDQLGELAGKRITVLGLAFKPGTDDMRESPALAIVPELARQGAKITCHDPIALHTGQAMLSEGGLDLSEITFTQDLAAALADCDAVMIVTRWPEYEAVPAMLSEAGATQAWIIDGRRMIGADDYVHYAGIGLG